jgi:L-2,4-diaminobutyric acid acetyltransferase
MNFNKIIIRKIEFKDASSVYKVVKNCIPLDLNSVYSYSLLGLFFHDTCFVAVLNNSIIGFVSGFITPTCKSYFLWQIGVLPEYRNSKIALLLLENILKTAKKNLCKKIKLTIDPKNIKSKNLFQKFVEINDLLLIEKKILRLLKPDGVTFQDEQIIEIIL